MEESDDLLWMHSISLANNKSEQNLEIIYNDKNVFFKTVKSIYQNEELVAFPSKDLEISLGLQFIPVKTDDNYQCRKCLQNFRYQYHLMLHNRYFCSLTANNLMRTVIDNRNNGDLIKKEKRKLNDSIEQLAQKRLKPTEQQINHSNIYLKSLEANMAQFSQVNKINEKYFENLISNFLATTDKSKEAIDNTSLIKSIFDRLSSYTHQLNQLGGEYKNFINPNLISNSYNQIQTVFNNTDHLKQSINNFPIEANKAEPKLNKKAVNHSPKQVKAPTSNNYNANEINQMINTQTLQNWCAKCNTHFRLTQDLVFHMRSFHRTHRKDGTIQPFVSQTAKDQSADLIDLQLNVVDEKVAIEKADQSLKSKYLKCEICYEVFKERHHLSRHMTSHR